MPHNSAVKDVLDACSSRRGAADPTCGEPSAVEFEFGQQGHTASIFRCVQHAARMRDALGRSLRTTSWRESQHGRLA